MYVNGVYSSAEAEMLDAFRVGAKKLTGWAGEANGKTLRVPLNLTGADYTMIRIMARSYDAKNPLYSDRVYAEQSRWGRVIAPPMFLLNAAQFSRLPFDVAPEVGTVISVQCGSDFIWNRPVYEGDRIRVFCDAPEVIDVTPEGEQSARKLEVRNTNRYFDEAHAEIGTITHTQLWTYTEPGIPREAILRAGYELSGQTAFAVDDVRTTTPYVYSAEQANALQDFYEAERRRGDVPLHWEDVQVGERLPATLFGPITEWDQVGAIGPGAEKTLTMMEIRQRYPDKLIYDEYGVPHHRDEIYLSKVVPKITNGYSSSTAEQIIGSAMLRTVTNWMGDDGFITAFSWRELAKVCLCDTIFASGVVTGRHCDAAGRHVLEIELNVADLRGYISHAGVATVVLPGTGAETDERKAETGLFAPGDLFRISSDACWPFGAHPLAGRTGRIVELLHAAPGYAYALLGEDCTGLDPRAVIGVKLCDLEKR
jgi:acyl dehydratase